MPTVQLGQPASSLLDISCGEAHTCVLWRGGGVKCWCAPRGSPPSAPTAARGTAHGAAHRPCAALTHARARGLVVALRRLPRTRRGANDWGQLGLGSSLPSVGSGPGSMGASLPWLRLGGTHRADAVVASAAHHTCVLMESGEAKCFGANYHGQLGLGDQQDRGKTPDTMGDRLPAMRFGKGARIKVSERRPNGGPVRARARRGSGWASGVHAARAAPDAPASAREREASRCPPRTAARGAARGLPARRARPTPAHSRAPAAAPPLRPWAAQLLRAGEQHTCALLEPGHVKCVGRNEFGQLGTGDDEARGDSAQSVGDRLPVVDLGTAPGHRGVAVLATDLVSGAHFNCALLETRDVRCWGGNYYGELGTGDDEARGLKPAQMGDRLPTVALGAGVLRLDGGGSARHMCALLEDGDYACWGSNEKGQLAQGTPDAHVGDRYVELSALQPARLSGASVRKPYRGAAGQSHHCALLADGDLKCVGDNDDGQLGYGARDTRRAVPPPGRPGRRARARRR